MSLTTNIRHSGAVAIVDLAGQITLGDSTGRLRDTLRSLLSQGTKHIVLNMGNVGYVDSSGLGELVGIYTTATNQGAAVKLLNVQKKLRDLMQITKLHTVFESFENEGQAVASFSKASSA